MRRVRFTTTAGLVIELVEGSSRRVPFPGVVFVNLGHHSLNLLVGLLKEIENG
ncbi:MAG: hypothetical protein ABSG32_34005 [Terriglobia bacterium]|jgi:hypothetical protein